MDEVIENIWVWKIIVKNETRAEAEEEKFREKMDWGLYKREGALPEAGENHNTHTKIIREIQTGPLQP